MRMARHFERIFVRILLETALQPAETNFIDDDQERALIVY